jgi:cytoskeleton protein RodZ
MNWRRSCVVAIRLRQNTRLINVEHLMSDQQGSGALVPGVVSGAEELGQVLPGALLAQQRQAKGWSVEHAASQLKFATRQVLALESDNYAALPGPVIVRGFVRAYAKLLGMDANALVATLPQGNAVPGERIMPQRTLSTPFSESPLPLGNRKKLSPVWFVGVGAVVLLVAAGVVLHKTDVLDHMPQLAWLKQVGKPAEVADSAAAQASAEQADLPPEVQEAADHGKPEKDEVAPDAGAATASVAAASEPAAVPAAVVASTAVAPVSPVPAAAASVSAPAANSAAPVAGNLHVSNGKDLLRLNFREDSWVEIRRADNSTMISRLLKAGTTESFDITEPVILVVGNAAGVDASLRGSKLDLQASNNSNVARLNLK